MLKDKVIVVCGGAGRIGAEFSKMIPQNNGIVVIADLNENLGNSLAVNICNEFGANKAIFVKIDITSKESIENCIDIVNKKFGKIDAVVNAAYPRSASFGALFFDTKYEDFCADLNLQLGGAFLIMQQFAKYFKIQGYGNIISLSSIQGVVAPKFETYRGTDMCTEIEYSAIKAGLIHMVKYLAKYLKGSNIRVNCITPGGVLDGQNPIFLEQYKNVCLNKGMLDPCDLNGAMLFLLSDGSKYVNGQNIVVDDGFCL